MGRGDCLSDQVLLAFHLGQLPEALLDNVAEHLEVCSRCEARVQELEAETDQVLSALRRAASAPPAPAPADVALATVALAGQASRLPYGASSAETYARKPAAAVKAPSIESEETDVRYYRYRLNTEGKR